jgi:hypothetical protein
VQRAEAGGFRILPKPYDLIGLARALKLVFLAKPTPPSAEIAEVAQHADVSVSVYDRMWISAQNE